MKNILIPTTLEKDTVQAFKVALAQNATQPQTIFLMLLKESPDVASAAYWLRKTQHEFTPQQEALLEKCRELAAAHPECKLQIHQQFSINAPLLRNFTEACEIGLVILPDSFSRSKLAPNRQLVNLLRKSKTPILRLTPEVEEFAFSKALYLENEASPLAAKDLTKMIGGHFSFRIISQAKFFDEQNHVEMTPILYDTINKNGIDLLIETRKPEKSRLFKNNSFTEKEHLGLPVLSLSESAY